MGKKGWADSCFYPCKLVKQRVIKDISFICEIETASDTGFSVTEYIPGKTNLRTKSVLRIFRSVTQTGPVLIECRDWRSIRVGEEVGVVVITNAEAQRQIVPYPPLVADIKRISGVELSAERQIMRRGSRKETRVRTRRKLLQV